MPLCHYIENIRRTVIIILLPLSSKSYTDASSYWFHLIDGTLCYPSASLLIFLFGCQTWWILSQCTLNIFVNIFLKTLPFSFSSGVTPTVLIAYSCLSAQGSFPVVLWGSHGVPGIWTKVGQMQMSHTITLSHNPFKILKLCLGTYLNYLKHILLGLSLNLEWIKYYSIHQIYVYLKPYNVILF